MSAFEELGVCPELIRVAEEQGWLLPTAVQAEAVPLILGGGDVLAAAETGSGKTGAFGMPILQIVHEALRDAAATGAGIGGGGGGAGGASASTVTMSTGWSTSAASLDGLGTDKQGFGFGGTGKKSHNRSFDNYGEPYGNGDVVGCMIDRDARTVSFTKNGAALGVAFELPDALSNHALFPAVCLKNAECRVNFGGADGKAFRYPPGGGYVGVAAAAAGTFRAASEEGDGLGGGLGGGRAGKGGGKVGKTTRTPKALVLEPARDLAEQTHTYFTDFAKHLTSPSVKSSLLVGGLDAGAQIRQLRDGCDIVTGTPGRIIDFVESGKLDVSGVRFFVLDEADRLLDTGNQAAILKLFERMPKSGEGFSRLQVLLFSATLHSPEINALAGRLTQNATWVDLKGKDAVPETVHHAVVMVDPAAEPNLGWSNLKPVAPTDNLHALDNVGKGGGVASKEAESEGVKRLKPHVLRRLIDTHKMDQCLIFCRTNFDCDNLEKFLTSLGGGRGYAGKAESGKENPYSCVVLGGARSMEERRHNLQAFKEGDVRFLICTDVAARGLDIQGLPYVINMTLPDKSEDYIHRIGRVGRADTMGLAISLVSAKPEKVWYCSKKGYKPWFNPTKEDTKQHAIWYDERALLKEIEARIKHPVAPLGKDLSLPSALTEKLGGGVGGVAGEVGVYGRAKGGGASKEVTAHLEAYAPAVRRLAELEVQAQASFWSLKRKFASRG